LQPLSLTLSWKALQSKSGKKSGLGNATGSDAAGADPNPLVRLSFDHPNPLQIRIPASPRQVMSVTHAISVNRAFIADFTACHCLASPSFK
jgi:hypothetical protein